MSSLPQIYRADFRLRTYIFTCLQKAAENTKHHICGISPQNAAFQLALCYKIGFGTTRSELMVQRCLASSGLTKKELESQLDSIRKEFESGEFYEGMFKQLSLQGHIFEIEAGQYYRDRKLLHRVIDHYKREITDLENVFGDTYWLNWTLKRPLALIMQDIGQWKEAEELDRKVMEMNQKALGQEHPVTVISMADLATIYEKQGRWKETEALELNVVKTSQNWLGTEHPFVLSSMATLASTYRNQGRWKDAEELEVNLLGTSQRLLGSDHLFTLWIMSNLAETYTHQGRYKEGEELEKQVLEISLKILGHEHPTTLASMVHLTLIHMRQGQWKEV